MMLTLFLAAFILAACQPVAVALAPAATGLPILFGQTTVTHTPFQPVSPTLRPTFTLTPTVTLTPTFTPTATVPPSPTPQPCLNQAGHIEQMEEALLPGYKPLHFRVYFPPCFEQNSAIRYPVLYMIHGQTFADDQWERLGIGPAADALIQAGQAPPFLIVMPQENDTYADIYLTSFSRNVTDGLVPWIDAHYPTCSERACRAIGGLSRGGAWALHLGYTHWELFGAIGMHSTPPFNTDPGLFPAWLQKVPVDQLPRMYLDIGRRDPFLSNATAFEAELVRYNVPHAWYLFNGTHEEAYWSAHVSEYLAWYVQGWLDLPQSSQVRLLK